MLCIARCCRLIATAIIMSVVVAGQSQSALSKSSKINFDLLYRAAKLSNQAYDGKSKIIAELRGNSVSVATPGKAQVQYFIGYDDKRKAQGISVRGTVNDANWALNKDVRLVRDKKTGIMMHHGFQTAAQAVYKDVRSKLKRGYTTYVTGHSLGGAVAAIVGIYLRKDGVKLGKIVTFGQPKFTDKAGAKAYANLPMIRVVHQNDTVALLPDKDDQGREVFAHVGPIVNLLKEEYYLYASEADARQFSVGSFHKFFSQISLPDHQMKWYLYNLRVKQGGTKRVSYKDRNRYIVRHKYGTGRDTVPAKPRYNFNHHH